MGESVVVNFLGGEFSEIGAEGSVLLMSVGLEGFYLW